MLLDWNNPPELDAPRRRMVRGQSRDREKLARAKAKRFHRPKNHATNEERSYNERTLAKKLTLARQAKDAAHQAYKLAVRAFFLGEREDFPIKP